MRILEWFFLIHFGICLLLLFLRMQESTKYEYSSILISALIPFFGVLLLLERRYSDRHRDREAAKLEVEHMHAEEEKKSISPDTDEREVIPLNEALVVNDNKTRRRMMMDIMYDVNRSINRDPDETHGMTVPLEEAMIVNDSATRRALLIDVLYANPADYISQLFDAKANEDTEVVHYAATALTEIQKDYDTRFQDLARRREESPGDPRLEEEYRALLESYIRSGLLKGDGLRASLRQLSSLLGSRLLRPDTRGKWSLVNRKAETDLQLGDAEALRQDVEMMCLRWPDRENTYLYRIHLAALQKDAKEIQRVIAELKEKEIYLSPGLRSIIRFWGGEQGADRQSA